MAGGTTMGALGEVAGLCCGARVPADGGHTAGTPWAAPWAPWAAPWVLLVCPDPWAAPWDLSMVCTIERTLAPWLGTAPPTDFSVVGRGLLEGSTSGGVLATALGAGLSMFDAASLSGLGGGGIRLLGDGIGLCALRVEPASCPSCSDESSPSAIRDGGGLGGFAVCLGRGGIGSVACRDLFFPSKPLRQVCGTLT